MKRRSVLCLVAGLALASPAVSLRGQTADVTILDWNILQFDAPGTSAHQALVRIVEAIDPDVLLLQEAQDSTGQSAFLSYFSARYPYTCLGSPGNGNPRNMIVSAYPLTASGMLFTADPNGGTFERPTIWADLDILPTVGSELRVYSAHYKSGSASRDNTLRLNQATTDSAHAAALLSLQPQARIYYAGDLNADQFEAPVIQMQTALTRYSMLNPNNGSDTTRWPSGRTIDHVLYSPALSGKFLEAYIFHSETYAFGSLPPPAQSNDSQTASDHLTLVSTVRVGATVVTSGVKINEVLIDPSTSLDQQEFIELHGPANALLNGYHVVIIEGDAGNPGVIDRSWDLSGKSLSASGFFTLGTSATNPDLSIGTLNVLENGTQTILLVQGLTATVGQDVDGDNDGVVDLAIGSSIEDALGFSDGGTGDFIYYDGPVFGPLAGVLPAGGGRCPDGYDTDSPGDLQPLSGPMDGTDGNVIPTPRTPNGHLPVDFDQDCDVDVDDALHMRDCATGATVDQQSPACATTDLDGDGDTDQADFGLFQRRITGPRF